MAGANLVLFEQTAKRLGATLLPDNEQWTLRMEIRSETSSRLYIVALNKNSRTWGCSCPGWKSRRNCKHLTAMVPLLESALKTPTGSVPRVSRSR